MDEIFKLITEAQTFYLATISGNKPRIRPFGFVMKYNGKLYFCTGNQKAVYRQLKDNPHFEVCAMAPDGRWLRLCGSAVFDVSSAAKAKAFEMMPCLAAIYSSPENLSFEVFYLSGGEATIYSFTDPPRVVLI